MAVYNSNSIKVYSDIEAVRKHPHIYAGDNEEFALYLTVKEIFQNSFDEVVQYGSTVVMAHAGNGFVVYDDGRGIPVDAKAHGTPAIKLIFEKLNSGGKSQGEYGNATIGVHGVGCVVSNALSNRLIAASYREKKWHFYASQKGRGNMVKMKLVDIPGFDYIKHYVKQKGTLIFLEPDLTFFGDVGTISEDIIKKAFWINSVANPKKKYIYIDSQGEEHLFKDEASKFSKNSFKLFSEKVGLILTPQEGEMLSYVCGAPTPEHGTHWQGFLKAYEKAIEPFVKKNQSFDIEDALHGFSGILNYSITMPVFSGQAKQKLKSRQATADTEKALAGPLKDWVKKHSRIVRAAIDKAVKIKNLENKLKQERTLEKTITTGKSLPYDLTSCPYAKPKDRELYLMEGQSASGPAKKARDEKYQEVLPIDGKILNVYRSSSRAHKSEAIENILRSIGYSINDPNLEKARVRNKIVILTDQDQDGAHIRILILAALWRFVPQAFHQKMVYYADTPLYSYRNEKGGLPLFYGNSITDLKAEAEKKKLKFNPEFVSRAKGWGEVSPAHLRHIAFDPNTRKLVNVPPLTKEDEKDFFGIVQAVDATYRANILGLPLESLTGADGDEIDSSL